MLSSVKEVTLMEIEAAVRQKGRNVTRTSRGILINCPFHNDSTPSCAVYQNGFYCFGCGKHGGLRQLISVLYSTNSAYNTYERHNVAPYQNNLYRQMSFSWRKFLDGRTLESAFNLSRCNFLRAEEYLRKRGIFDAAQFTTFGFWNGYLIIPVIDREYNLRGIIGRDTTGKANTRYTYSPSLRGYNRPYVPDVSIYKNKPDFLVVTFGIFDAISLRVAGIPAVSTLSGKDQKHTFLDGFRLPIYIVPDKDEISEAYKLANRLSWRGAGVVILPYSDEEKDPNDFLVRRGRDVLYKTVISAITGGKYDAV